MLALTASQVTLAIVLITFAAAIAGAVIVLAKQSSMSQNIDMFATANGELRGQNAGMRDEITELRQTIIENDKECGQRIAKLEGKLEALTDGLGEQIAAKAISAIKEMM